MLIASAVQTPRKSSVVQYIACGVKHVATNMLQKALPAHGKSWWTLGARHELENRYVASVTLKTGIASILAGANSKQPASSLLIASSTWCGKSLFTPGW